MNASNFYAAMHCDKNNKTKLPNDPIRRMKNYCIRVIAVNYWEYLNIRDARTTTTAASQ